jgi:DNA-binding NtrC family response regulator
VAPPLRERQEDIPLLTNHFLHLVAAEMGKEALPLKDEVQARLQQYSFPGNVRELKNIVERALIESGDGEIKIHHLYLQPRDGAPSPAPVLASAEEDLALPLDIDQAIACAERWVVRRALEKSDGNVSAATRLLGTNRNRIYRILEQDKPTSEN